MTAIYPERNVCALYNKNFVVRRYITVNSVNVSLEFQEIIKPQTPMFALWFVTYFWLSAWWALWLPWWPPAECSNVSMSCKYWYLQNVFFIPVSLLYSVGNKTYYYYITKDNGCQEVLLQIKCPLSWHTTLFIGLGRNPPLPFPQNQLTSCGDEYKNDIIWTFQNKWQKYPYYSLIGVLE